jgi:hypothetical protein
MTFSTLVRTGASLIVAAGLVCACDRAPEAHRNSPSTTTSTPGNPSGSTASSGGASSSTTGVGRGSSPAGSVSSVSGSVDPAAREALASYLTELNDLVAGLQSVQSVSDAQNFRGTLDSAITRIGQQADRIGKLSLTDRAALLAEGRSELTQAAKRFQEQLDRINRDESLKSALSQDLSRVRLLEP